MAKCKVTVALEEPSRAYVPGETVKGVVRVRVHQDMRCDGLNVALQVKASGKGNTRTEDKESTTLYRGDWRAGEVHAYPFEFDVPAHPVPYEGKILKSGFQIKAEVEVPWARDIGATHPLIVRPVAETVSVRWDEEKLATRAKPGCFMVSFLGFVFTGILFVALGGFGLERAGVWGFGAAMAGLLVGVILSLTNHLAEGKAGKVRMSLHVGGSGGYREPGDDGMLRVRIRLKSGAKVTAVVATLRAYEIAIRGSGSKTRVHRHLAFEEEVHLREDGGGVYQGRLRLPSPLEAPYSFRVRDNTIEWSVMGHVDIPGWPDWRNEVPLTVLPEGRSLKGEL